MKYYIENNNNNMLNKNMFQFNHTYVNKIFFRMNFVRLLDFV